MLTITHIFYLIGALLAGTAVLDARERRWSVAAFWAILAVPFFVGDQILAAATAGTRFAAFWASLARPHFLGGQIAAAARTMGTQWPAQAMGIGVIALAVLAARHRTRPVDDGDPVAREASAARLGNRLFLPALMIPVLTGVLVLDSKYLHSVATRWIEPGSLALIALGVASVLALIAALWTTRARPIHGLTEGGRLVDTIGWPLLLPMMLAALGAMFAATHVGDAIARLVAMVISTDSRVACLLAYGLGMVVFTTIMGNAFAAFPVMTAGIGLPLLVKGHGADPAALGALGMLTGYCGTLLTPMAANFNIVPAILLELRDEYGVIRAQWPTSLVLLSTNLVLMYLLVFR